MSLIAGDPLTQLAFSIYENKGVYAVLLGSGISRSAEIPTGWEITLDLVRRVALSRGVTDQLDWAAWYSEQTGKPPNYSTLLEELASSREERRAILHSYIEPTELDHQEGRKVPTTAHKSIADLVRGGYIRIIITTNFDRLMENALRERGIEPTVVSSVDALAGAEPIIHSTCYLMKLHGDYKDARILNTETELSVYPEQYNTLLDRILDEHGLVVCGWSGEWDYALRAAILRAPNRRYSVFWAARGSLGTGAQELIDHRRAHPIPIADANNFFSSLHQRVETLERNHRQNPLSIELLINSTKRFLAKSEYRIQLDELFTTETKRLTSRLDTEELGSNSPWDPRIFRESVEKYECASETLSRMVGVLGRWGDNTEISLVLDIITSLLSHAGKVRSGLTSFLNLRSYPAVLVFTAYSLGLSRAGRWSALHQFLTSLVYKDDRDQARLVDTLFLWEWQGYQNNVWNQIEGLERHRTPLSERLLSIFAEWSQSFIGLASDFELTFERFELLGSLAHFERNTRVNIEKELGKESGDGYLWMPVGRSSWNEVNANRLLSELQSEQTKSDLIRAGFADGDPELIKFFVQNFRVIAKHVRWR